MFILKKGHQPGVYVPLRALFLVCFVLCYFFFFFLAENSFFNGLTDSVMFIIIINLS